MVSGGAKSVPRSARTVPRGKSFQELIWNEKSMILSSFRLFNEPKYHAMLLRSVEPAKHRYNTPTFPSFPMFSFTLSNAFLLILSLFLLSKELLNEKKRCFGTG